jgi:hypothetical protein
MRRRRHPRGNEVAAAFPSGEKIDVFARPIEDPGCLYGVPANQGEANGQLPEADLR